MKMIVIGGPGRSGTSLLTEWFANNPKAVTFGPKVESKFFVEAYGLIDLYRALVSDYCYSRATTAIAEFRVLMLSHLPTTYHGQPPITTALLPERKNEYGEAIEKYINRLQPNGTPLFFSHEDFFAETKHFVEKLISLYANTEYEFCFVEKTPHNCLNSWIFENLIDDVRYVWVVRDPRAIAYSTYKMDWGPTTIPGAIDYTKQILRRFAMQKERPNSITVKVEDLNDSDCLDQIQRHCEFGLSTSSNTFNPEILDDWRNLATAEQFARLSSDLQPEIEELGYRA